MLSRTLLVALVLACADTVHGDDPFAISLWSSSANLSPQYRAAIRQATAKYRGDATEATVRRYYIYFFTLSTGKEVRIDQPQFEKDPFPAELLSFDYVAQLAPRASNPAMQLTPSRTVFILYDD